MKRFWSKVEIGGEHECWEWTGAKSHGYGNFKAHGKFWKAHRFAYELVRDSIPHGLVLDHLCRNPGCVNPFHLEAVTQKVNVQRGNVPKTHCLRGHERSPENLTDRHCKVCAKYRDRPTEERRAYQRKYYQKNKEKRVQQMQECRKRKKALI